MLRQQDSLGLSNEVADSIAILNKAYGKIIDSIWTPVAEYLAALPGQVRPRRGVQPGEHGGEQVARPDGDLRSVGQEAADRRSRFESCRRSSRCSSTTRRFARFVRAAPAADEAGSSAAEADCAARCVRACVLEDRRGYFAGSPLITWSAPRLNRLDYSIRRVAGATRDTHRRGGCRRLRRAARSAPDAGEASRARRCPRAIWDRAWTRTRSRGDSPGAPRQ